MFSIIIPTYNQDYFLKNALESVINQTFQEWEAIVINNYSEDNTLEIIESFNDIRIKSTNFSNFGVIAASRNFGLSLSIYPYISFLDSDDTWHPEKLEKTLFYLKNDIDLVCHDEIWTWSDNTHKLVSYGPKKNSVYENLLFNGNVISTSAVSVRKDLMIELNGFNESPSMIGNEDYDLWMRISMKTKNNFKFINEPLGYYVIHENNTSKKLFRQLKSEIFVIKKHFNNSIIEKNPKNLLRLIIRISRAIVGSILRSNDFVYKSLIRIIK